MPMIKGDFKYFDSKKISFWEITTRKGRTKYLVSSTKLGSYMLELDICQSIKVATKMLPSVGRIYLSAGGYNTLAST